MSLAAGVVSVVMVVAAFAAGADDNDDAGDDGTVGTTGRLTPAPVLTCLAVFPPYCAPPVSHTPLAVASAESFCC